MKNPKATAVFTAEEPRLRQLYGRIGYAKQAYESGKIEAARAYCAKHGLPFPPLREMPGRDVLVALDAAQNPAPQAPANHAETPAQGVAAETTSDESHAVQGEPARGLPTQAEEHSGAVKACSPIETASSEPVAQPEAVAPEPATEPTPLPKWRKCRVNNFCPNPRLVGVRLLDNGEEAAMWVSRHGYRLGDIVEVELERGTEGVNAIYSEVRKAV